MSDCILTQEQLAQMIPGNPYVAEWYEALAQLLPDYDINTPQRVAAFVAQCAHESGGFRAIKENLNYRAVTLRKVFPKYFPTMLQQINTQAIKKLLPIVYMAGVWATVMNLQATVSVIVVAGLFS